MVVLALECSFNTRKRVHRKEGGEVFCTLWPETIYVDLQGNQRFPKKHCIAFFICTSFESTNHVWRTTENSKIYRQRSRLLFLVRNGKSDARISVLSLFLGFIRISIAHKTNLCHESGNVLEESKKVLPRESVETNSDRCLNRTLQECTFGCIPFHWKHPDKFVDVSPDQRRRTRRR